MHFSALEGVQYILVEFLEGEFFTQFQITSEKFLPDMYQQKLTKSYLATVKFI